MEAIDFQQIKAPGGVSVDDRRQYVARIPAIIEMTMTTADQKASARSIDVSVAGLQVQSKIELKLDDRAIVSVGAPGDQMHVCALIARVSPADEPEAGTKYGLRILSEDIPRWQSVLRKLIL